MGAGVRSCGECTLCCRLERIAELAKPRNEWCVFCEIGKGCAIYGDHPNSCKSFKCWWLTNFSLGAEYRPDMIGAYAAGDPAAGYLRIMVDHGDPAILVDAVRSAGLHAIVNRGNQISFLQGEGQPKPERIMLDWIL